MSSRVEADAAARGADDRGAEAVEALVRSAQGGDPRAFRDLMEVYQRAFYGLARRYSGSHEDADDVLQESFVKIYNHIGGLTSPAAFFAWARRIVVNTALDQIRRQRPDDPLDDQVADSGISSALEGGYEPPDRGVERREFFARVERALRTLPPKQREVVTLHDVDGVPTEEIAERLDCPRATVRSNLFYGREKLRAILGGS